MRIVTVESPRDSLTGTTSDLYSRRARVSFVSRSSKPQITHEKWCKGYTSLSERPWCVNGKRYKSLQNAVLEFLTANPAA